MEFLTLLLADASWVTPVTLMVSAVVGSLVTFFATKEKEDKELSINDRTQLSKDQYQLIAELKEMLKEQKGEINFLRAEIKDLQDTNVRLILENRELQGKITELNHILSKFD